MYPDPIDYERIERRVAVRFQRRYRFFIHSAVFVIGIPLIAQFNSAGLFLVWVALWLFHLIWMNYHHNLERAVDDEIEIERERTIKRKRDYAELQQQMQATDEHYPPVDDAPYHDEVIYDERDRGY